MIKPIKMQDTINQLAINNQALTMSSLEISELVQSRHDSVKRSIERLAEQEVIGLPPLVDINKNGIVTKVYVFSGEQGKLDSITVVAQLCPQFTAKLVKRWYELEQSQSPIPQTYPDALRAYADEVEKRMALEHQAKLDAPKVAHYDLVADRTNLVNATQVASKVKMSAVVLNRYLDDLGVYNKAVKRNKRTFNHWFIESGLGQMVQTDTGFDQALFTHKGEAWVVEQLISEGVIA